MPAKGEMYESAHWRLDVDEDESELSFWRGAGAGDKEEFRFDPGEPMTLNPRHFPNGTLIEASTENAKEPFLRIELRKAKRTPSWFVRYGSFNGVISAAGEPILLYPSKFEIGMYIVFSEPWDEEFYERLLRERK